VPRYNIDAIVLKKINYGDSDRIYTLLTRDRGKISVLAKGVRKISSRRSGNLDTLNRVVVSISENHAGFKILTEAKTLNSFKELKRSLEKSLSAYYMAELINKSVEENMESSGIFDLLNKALEKTEEETGNITLVVNKFEIRLMKALGYEITLEKLRSFGREDLDRKLKEYVKDSLGEDFKSLRI
jgi:DNA repair protein RecO (recombination protein O)